LGDALGDVAGDALNLPETETRAQRDGRNGWELNGVRNR
jgi:hypothetical protein